MFKEYVAYLKDNPKGYWFKRRLYGWGWVPVRWQGWLVVTAYLALIIAFSSTIDDSSPPEEVMYTFILPLLLLTATLIRICYKTGEKPLWQWGTPEQSPTNHDPLHKR